MCFEQLDEERLRAVLTGADLQRYHLTYESLDYANAATKTALFSILERAKREIGYTPAGGKLLVEVFPFEEGCIIYFSCSEKAVSGAVLEPLVFTFACCEDMLAACTRVFARYCHRIHKSALYYLDGRYRLIIYPLDGQNSLSAAFLCEYAQPTGQGIIAAAYVAEHGKPIAEENAIDKISYYLS